MEENIGINCFCPHCGNKINIQIERIGKVGGILGGAISGAILGSKIGIAGGPMGAIAGTIPGLVLGVILGDNLGSSIDNPTCLKCSTSFKIPQKSIEEYKKRISSFIDDKIEDDYLKDEIHSKIYGDYFFKFLKCDIREIFFRNSLKRNNIVPVALIKDDVTGDRYTIDFDLFATFNNLIKVFGLDKDYLTSIENEIYNIDILHNNDNSNNFLNFLKDFKNTFYKQIENPRNEIVENVFSFEQDKDLYYDVLKYFFKKIYELISINTLVKSLEFKTYNEMQILEKKLIAELYLINRKDDLELIERSSKRSNLTKINFKYR